MAVVNLLKIVCFFLAYAILKFYSLYFRFIYCIIYKDVGPFIGQDQHTFSTRSQTPFRANVHDDLFKILKWINVIATDQAIFMRGLRKRISNCDYF